MKPPKTNSKKRKVSGIEIASANFKSLEILLFIASLKVAIPPT
jgi:hypothetical protein